MCEVVSGQRGELSRDASASSMRCGGLDAWWKCSKTKSPNPSWWHCFRSIQISTDGPWVPLGAHASVDKICSHFVRCPRFPNSTSFHCWHDMTGCGRASTIVIGCQISLVGVSRQTVIKRTTFQSDPKRQGSTSWNWHIRSKTASQSCCWRQMLPIVLTILWAQSAQPRNQWAELHCAGPLKKDTGGLPGTFVAQQK